jgi:Flp pilus assembly protein TadD
VALFNAQRHAELEAKARDLTARDPGAGFVWKILGASLGLQGKDACPALQRAAQLLPHDAEAHNNLGNALRSGGRIAEALASCQQALRIRPDFAEAHNNLGNALRDLGEFRAAATSYRRALSLKPRYAEAYNNLGNASIQLDELEEAVLSYLKALEIRPEYAEAYNNLGHALLQIGRVEDAVESCLRALRLNPRYAAAHNNLGNALLKFGQPREAVASYRRAVQLEPGYADAHNSLGSAFLELAEFAEAAACYEQAIALQPNLAGARLNRAMLSLLQGEFENGWVDYEWRWQASERLRRGARVFSQPHWFALERQELIAGMNVLLYGEQGLGDTLQFCRYVKQVAALGARVILEVPVSLHRLMGALEGVSHVVAKGDALPQFDCHCSLLSLPMAFKTTVDTIPAAGRYVTAENGKIAQWRARLAEKTAIRVGLVWRGNPRHKRDHARSISLAELIRHLPVGLQYVSLQKQLHEAEKGQLEAAGIRQFAADLHDFSDTAALCECMDLVLTVDTSVAHLSGALAKETWILLPPVPDWRWLLDRPDSPWYSTAKLYRRASAEGWSGVLARVNSDLRTRAGMPGQS